MSQETISVKLKNININVFTNLINQSLLVSQQLMFEFSPKVIKSVNISASNTFMKIWVSGISNIIKSKKDEIEEIDSLDSVIPGLEPEPEEDINLGFDKTFNMYLLKGEQFKNVLKIFKNDTIDIEFFLKESEGGYQATSLIIYGRSENDRPLKTEFLLTVEKLISNKISDYNQILSHCQPKQGMVEISLTENNINEIKKLIASLHKTIPNNSSFVTFIVTEDYIKINDKVFDITFDDIKTSNLNGNELAFNILKSDFGLIGNQSFKLYTSFNDNEIHIGSSYNNAIIYSITAKVHQTEDALNSTDDSDLLTADDLAAYDLEEFK